jgi:photosystem II stability/assembly factor-like uncharacterized protein
MPFFSFARVAAPALVISAALLGWSSVAVSGASTHAAAAAVKPPKTVTAVRVTRRPGTIAPGTPVPTASLFGQRVFTGSQHGFALAAPSDADYPVATTDGGKTWKTDGPALHLHAANAPAVVLFIGAVNRKTVFAWGGGQVIDTTRDGGKNWYSALFPNAGPVAVARELNGHLVALVGSSSGASIWQYVSKDGGRTWHYQTTVSQ